MSASPGRPGLFAALQGTTATLLGMAQTRLELASVELQIEKVRLLRQLALAFGMVICIAFCLELLVTLVALLFWDHRIAVVAVFAVLFLLLAGWLYSRLRHSIYNAAPLFSSSISELQKDLAQLRQAVDASAAAEAKGRAP
jgi:uncharacterized membrane protein YqjE